MATEHLTLSGKGSALSIAGDTSGPFLVPTTYCGAAASGIDGTGLPTGKLSLYGDRVYRGTRSLSWNQVTSQAGSLGQDMDRSAAQSDLTSGQAPRTEGQGSDQTRLEINIVSSILK